MNPKHFNFSILLKQIMVMEVIISLIILFVGITVLITIHICIVGRAFRRGFDFESGDGVLQRGSVPIVRGINTGMTPQDLKILPCFEYKEGGTDCAVCLDSFKVGDKCRLLPNCHHHFHVPCIDIWLIKTPFCPICRTSARSSPKCHADIGQGSNQSSNIGGEMV